MCDQEMTLVEYMHALPKEHRARKEFEELVASNNRLRNEVHEQCHELVSQREHIDMLVDEGRSAEERACMAEADCLDLREQLLEAETVASKNMSIHALDLTRERDELKKQNELLQKERDSALSMDKGLEELLIKTKNRIEELSNALKWIARGGQGDSAKAILYYMTIGQSRYGIPSDEYDRERCANLLRNFPQWIGRLSELHAVDVNWSKQILWMLDEHRDLETIAENYANSSESVDEQSIS